MEFYTRDALYTQEEKWRGDLISAIPDVRKEENAGKQEGKGRGHLGGLLSTECMIDSVESKRIGGAQPK